MMLVNKDRFENRPGSAVLTTVLICSARRFGPYAGQYHSGARYQSKCVSDQTIITTITVITKEKDCSSGAVLFRIIISDRAFCSFQQKTAGVCDGGRPVVVVQSIRLADLCDKHAVRFHGGKCIVRETAGGIRIGAFLTAGTGARSAG